ncbi:MAG: hypothetical protein M5U19_13390 [Microthrixaceae bacterium]|nr:hypothetical protein [Microthrixaceae bacterium]
MSERPSAWAAGYAAFAGVVLVSGFGIFSGNVAARTVGDIAAISDR